MKPQQLAEKFSDTVVSISEIDTADDTFRLSLHIAADAVASSIDRIGLVNPPVLKRRHDLKYQIVCGFRRVAACKTLGWKEIKAHLLDGAHSERDALLLAILDNRSHRRLGVVEQARGIQRLSPHIRSEGRLEILSTLLGFPRSDKVLWKIEAVSGLPEPVQTGIIDETVSLEAAVALSRFSHEDASSLFRVLKALKLSQNKQVEVLSLAQEIAIREEIRPATIFEREEVRGILDHPKLNRNEKGARLRAYLKRRRFPEMTRAEQRFSEGVKALKLNECIRITPPACFEGGPYTLRVTFKDLKEFEDRCRSLESMAKNPALRRVLEPFDRPTRGQGGP